MCPHDQAGPTVPAAWHGIPEDQTTPVEESDADTAANEAKIAVVADDYSEATADALEASDVTHEIPAFLAQAPAAAPSDRVPWHMEYLMTDLSVSAGGLLGGLMMKGSPAVTFIWRKQHSQMSQPLKLENVEAAASRAADLSVSSDTSDKEMTMQLEPAIRVAVASGKVKDEKKLRSNLMVAARDFQGLASTVGENPGLDWWVSRLRLDLTFDATGVVTPVIGVGGDLRLRFEWHRIMKKAKSTAPKAMMALGMPTSHLREFMVSMAQDLKSLSDEQTKPDGFKAYSFRVGLGMTAKGDIGVVKATAGLIGDVYFSRDVAKPKVHSPEFEQELATLPSTINVIEDAKAPNAQMHETFAKVNSIAMEHSAGHSTGSSTSSGGDQVV